MNSSFNVFEPTFSVFEPPFSVFELTFNVFELRFLLGSKTFLFSISNKKVMRKFGILIKRPYLCSRF